MKYTTNLTEGNIRNELLILMFPLLLGNILQQLYNTIDAIIVGRFVSQTAFAAVGVAGTIMNLFIFVLSG
ncbi:MATE family efflux transporter, partial [Clostridioides difficile]|uniref:MATE family efflux transporter n=2 Tax=Clostridioides TaxID=1870884 RepID=UPI003F8D845B